MSNDFNTLPKVIKENKKYFLNFVWQSHTVSCPLRADVEEINRTALQARIFPKQNLCLGVIVFYFTHEKRRRYLTY